MRQGDAYIKGLEYGREVARIAAHMIRQVGLISNKEGAATAIDSIVAQIEAEIQRTPRT